MSVFALVDAMFGPMSVESSSNWKRSSDIYLKTRQILQSSMILAFFTPSALPAHRRLRLLLILLISSGEICNPFLVDLPTD